MLSIFFLIASFKMNYRWKETQIRQLKLSARE